MTYTNNHPTLIATSRCGSQVLNSIDDVAGYIMNAGVCGDVHMIDTDGNLFLTTNGIFIDYTADNEYRKELIEVLESIQHVTLEFITRCTMPLSKAEVLSIFASENASQQEDDTDDDDDDESDEEDSGSDSCEAECFHNFLD